MSLVEMLVGLAISSLILVGAIKLYVDHLRYTQATYRDLRLVQDMRSVVELWRTDLRHAGYWAQMTHGLSDGTAPPTNPHRVTSSLEQAGSNVTYSWSADTHSDMGQSQYGFDLRSGAVRFLRGSGGWQALTDPQHMVVTQFQVTPHTLARSLGHLCSPQCTLDQADCPRVNAVQMQLLLQAHPTGAPASASRAMQSAVHLPNPVMEPGRCPGA